MSDHEKSVMEKRANRQRMDDGQCEGVTNSAVRVTHERLYYRCMHNPAVAATAAAFAVKGCVFFKRVRISKTK